MEKMDGKTMDIVAENVAKLKELFPEAFTEDGTTKDTKSTKIDWDVLREVLGEYVSDKDERYSFTWNGKSKARMIAQTPSTGTLRPCKEESVDWDTTQNIFIEGDNLEVLKLLQKSYHKKVKMIYIDPPYNTGKDFVYKDNFKDNIKNYKEITGQVDGEGRNLSSNPETSGRYHTDWLNMMYPRLKLARNLLKDDGVIFISIDDNEVSNLRKMCDEIFGEENFLANIVWEKVHTRKNSSKYFSISHEHILAYAKFKEKWDRHLIPRDNTNAYKNPDNDSKGFWKPDPITAHNYYSAEYEIEKPNGVKLKRPQDRYWVFSYETWKNKVAKNEVIWGEGNSYPMIKRYLSEVQDGLVPITIFSRKFAGDTSFAKGQLSKLLNLGALFDYPKPSLLLKRLMQISISNNELVLDFFAGSSTTAHALYEYNSESAVNRNFIMVQLPEPCDKKSEAYKAGYKTIAELSKERIRRVATKIKGENPEYDGDLGFKVFKLDSTNIKPWEVGFDLTEEGLFDYVENIKTNRREEDVLYEVLLKYGLALDMPIEKWRVENGELRIIEEDDKETLNAQLSTLYSIGFCALVICLDDNITLETVEAITKLKEKQKPEIMRVVFKDSGFKDDVVKTNAVQILRTAGIVDVRSL